MTETKRIRHTFLADEQETKALKLAAHAHLMTKSEYIRDRLFNDTNKAGVNNV
jgi:hypothetical protein